MDESWIVTLPCSRAQAEALTADHPDLAAIVPAPALVASEEDEAADRWRIDAYFETRPPRASVQLLGRALGINARRLPRARAVPAHDWVTMSQAGIEPVSAGRFYVHTGTNRAELPDGAVPLRIDAGLAFGTGTHATTSGCLLALDRLARQGRRFKDILDVGTGTGLLAFAANHLWPRAAIFASDIDPVSIDVSADNAAQNGIALGAGRGRVTLAVADGVRHPAIAARAPHDLIIANILAGPLIELVPALAAIARPGTVLLMAGLLKEQRANVVRHARRSGWRLDDSGGDAEWPVLQFTLRERSPWRRIPRASGSGGLPPGDFGSW